ncbi:MAG: hypothetical protein ACE5F1_20420, partial [Planctomycetota bacterium]
YVRVFSGKDGAKLLEFRGSRVSDEVGQAVAGGEDLNADGVPDIVVGVRGWPNSFVTAISGKTGLRIWTAVGGSRLSGFGAAIAFTGDTDRDGVSDVIVGIGSGSTWPTFGGAWIYSGKTGLLLRSFSGGLLDGFGSGVSGAGDVNADGHADVIVGASGVAPLQLGYARVYSGKDWRTLLDLKPGPKGWTFGTSVAGVGDVDGDKTPDLAIGAPWSTEGNGSGTVTLVSGKTGATLATFSGKKGETAFGGLLAAGGDVNRDGIPDLLVAAAGFARLLSSRPLSLETDTHRLSLASGGSQTIRLDAGPAHRNSVYFLLGTASGTRPGIRFPKATLPLNPDSYFLLSLAYPNAWIRGSLGLLDKSGQARAGFSLPPSIGLPAGLVFHHAYAVLNLGKRSVEFASVAAPLLFVK